MQDGRINKEYVNEDELANKTAFKWTLAQVKKLYGDQPKCQ